MKKPELQAEAVAYEKRLNIARDYQQQGLYKLAMQAAIDAWEHIDGMLQYNARYGEQKVSTIAAIDLVLNYAPLLLDYKAIISLEAFCKNCRRLTRNDAFDVEAKLVESRKRLWENHRLWSHLLEQGELLQSSLRQVLGGDQDGWRSVAEDWEKMGLIGRTTYQNSYYLRLLTSMGRVVSAKCSHCGRQEQAPKAMFLEEIKCSKCHSTNQFVFCG